jgi:endonuclease/exonuclease/phosphatase (EEP) superfamily protein YafD
VIAILTPIGTSYRPKTKPDPSKITKALLVSSTNLLMKNTHTEGIVEELKSLNADVMVFQEYSPRWHLVLGKAFSSEYPYRVHKTRRDSFGAAIYSKLPFLNQNPRILVGKDHVPTYRVELMHDKVRWVLYNIHTLPPRKFDYVIEQRRQFRDLKAMFLRERDPVLLCGDFNWTEHTAFHSGLTDLGFFEGHNTMGRGRGDTWPVLGIGRYFPGIRLDHMYGFGKIHFLEHWCGYGDHSDHRPIFAQVAFKKA